MRLSDILKNRTKDSINNLATALNNDESIDFAELYSNLFLDIKPNPKNNYIADAKIIIMYVRYNYFLSCLNDNLKEFYRKKFRDMVYDECEDNTFELGKYVVDMKDGSPNIYDKINDRVVPKLFVMLYKNVGDENELRSLENQENIRKIRDELDNFSDKNLLDNYINNLDNKLKNNEEQFKSVLDKFKIQQFRINSLGIFVGLIILIQIIQFIF